MTLETFASKNRLKVKQLPEDGGASVIDGRQGQIYDGEFDDEQLAVSYTPGLDKKHRGIGEWRPKTAGNFRRSAIALGMKTLQVGDSELALLFDPKNRAQVRLAIKIAGARPKRKISPEHIERLQAARKAAD